MLPQRNQKASQKFENDKIKFYGFSNFWLAFVQISCIVMHHKF